MVVMGSGVVDCPATIAVAVSTVDGMEIIIGIYLVFSRFIIPSTFKGKFEVSFL